MDLLLFAASKLSQPAKIFWISVGTIIIILMLIAILKQFIIICPPNDVLVISGRSSSKDEGGGYRLAFGGVVFRIPILEEVRSMSLNTIPLHISVKNSYSKGGIVLNVEAVANIKISSDRKIIHNAIERFLERDIEEIRRTAQDTLEGNLREIIATLTPEEVNEDRLKFAKKMTEVIEEDLQKLGLHLDTLKIQHVSDDNDYLDSIGRKRVAEVIRDAEIAESNANREAENVAAQAKAQAQVAWEKARADIAKAENALRQLKAELEAKAKSEEEKTAAAAQEAKAKAEQELQQIRSELESLRLQADQVVPAEAQKQAKELFAKGEAAPIAENGKAIAKALELIATTWKEIGDGAKDIFVIQQLESIISQTADNLKNLQIEKITLIDNGTGEALPNYLRSYLDSLSSLLQGLSKTTGIDISEVLNSSERDNTPQGTQQS